MRSCGAVGSAVTPAPSVGRRIGDDGRRLVAIAEHQGCATADEGDDEDAEHGHGDRKLARLGRGRLGDLDLLGIFQDRGALGQVAVERGLLVHAEEAGVGFDVALGVNRRAEKARRHLFDGAQVADVDAGFAGDLFQRETGVFAASADFVADTLVDGGNSDVSVSHDAQVRGGTAGPMLGLVLGGILGRGRGLSSRNASVRGIGFPGFMFALCGNRRIRRRIGVGVVFGHAAHLFVRNGKAILKKAPYRLNATHPNR